MKARQVDTGLPNVEDVELLDIRPHVLIVRHWFGDRWRLGALVVMQSESPHWSASTKLTAHQSKKSPRRNWLCTVRCRSIAQCGSSDSPPKRPTIAKSWILSETRSPNPANCLQALTHDCEGALT
jgi:hypothetical protein